MKDPFLNTDNCVSRLVSEWESYGQLIVAFDYDNTVYDYYKKGDTFEGVIELLRKCKTEGFHLIIFTSCDESRYSDIKKYCKDNEIPYDSINETPDWIPFKGRKVYYNILLDDRAGLSAAYSQLSEVLLKIRILKRQKLLKGAQDIDF